MNTEKNIETARQNLIAAGQRLATADSGLTWANTVGYVDKATRAQIVADIKAAEDAVDAAGKAFEAAIIAHRRAIGVA